MIRRPSRRPRRRLAALLTAVVAAAGLAAQPPAPDGAAGAPLVEVAELPVEVLDAEGLPLAEVAAADLAVLAGGEPRPVLEVSREARPWRLVLYFDADLAAGPTLPRAAEALEAQAGPLTALGEVEVLLAADGVRTVLPPTRDPAMLAAALARLSLFERGRDRLVELREAEGAGAGPEVAPEGAALPEIAPGGSAAEGGDERDAWDDPVPATADLAAVETAFVQGRLDLLLERLAEPWRGTADGPRAVFWIGDGFDLDPLAWRRPEADDAGGEGVAPAGAATASPEPDRPADASGASEVPPPAGSTASSASAAARAAPDQPIDASGSTESPSPTTRAVEPLGEAGDEAADAAERPPTAAGGQSASPLPPASGASERPADLPGSSGPSPAAGSAASAISSPLSSMGSSGLPPAAGAGTAPGLPPPASTSSLPTTPPLLAAAGETARALAALGWTVAPVTLRTLDPAAPPSRYGADEIVLPDGNRLPVGTYRLPSRTPEQRAEDVLAAESPPVPPPVPVAPEEALALFAAASGGHVVGSAAGIAATVERLAARLRLRYAALPGEAGEPRPLSVAAAPGLRVAARAWTASPAPPALAALRARRLLDGALEPGPLEVQAAVLAGSAVAAGAGGEAAVEIEVDGLAAPPGATLRLTFATVGDDGLPRLEERRLPAPPPEAAANPASPTPPGAAEGAPAPADAPAPGRWTWRGTLRLPAAADRLAVLVEEPRSGAWGGALAGVVDLAAAPAHGWDAAAGVLPGPRAVHLLRPEGGMLAGHVRFETVVSPEVARVEFRLDGRRIAAAAAAPFAAVLDLGRLPLPRRIEAIAFDARGSELGRDETTVNGGAGRLRVRIVEPSAGRAAGAVTVAAEVEVPEGRRLDRVELYWRDRRVATLFQPPFRHRLMVGPDAPQGLLRAVARTLDGGEAEDAVLLNGAGPADRVDVALTELYVVATGADGRPVRGLGRGDFVVREDGRAQQIATFGDASELPLTLGLALDSSASMFVKLPEVREAALAVLDDLVPGRDQAFLVDFDDRARLAAGPTRDLGRLRTAARALEPNGRTSLWEAVVFSLVQLQGAAGRRALLLYSDGADEDGDLGFGTALDFARRVGVPVYAIVANAEAVRLGGLDLGILPSLGGRIERLAEATGGRAWVVRRGDDLAPYYAEIREELAAQYRLGYYPPAGGDGRWRRVQVEVRRPGVRARTVAGYRR